MSQAQLRGQESNYDAVFNLDGLPGYQDIRPTVSSLFCLNRKSVLLVQSAKDESGHTWGLPQGGIHPGESIWESLLRESMEELGICLDDDNRQNALPLAKFLNQLPSDRRNKEKMIYFAGVPIFRYPCVTLNENEITDFEWVKDWNHLWRMMGTLERERIDKCNAVWSAVEIAIDLNLLAWPKRPDYMSIVR